MSKKSDQNLASTQSHPISKKKVGVIFLGTFIDTTWRMFVPTIGMMLIGLWIDNLLNIKFVFMSVMLLAGCGLSYLLIRQQLKNLKELN